MVWDRPSSDSRKSSLVRSRTISPFLPYTLASRLTTLTSVEKVTSCAARAREVEASRPAAESIRPRREGRAAEDLPHPAMPAGFGLDDSFTGCLKDASGGRPVSAWGRRRFAGGLARRDSTEVRALFR